MPIQYGLVRKELKRAGIVKTVSGGIAMATGFVFLLYVCAFVF